MGSSGRMEGTSWVTLSLKSGLEPTRESPLGLCTAGRRRPWEALPGGKRGVSVLRHPGPALSHTVLRKGAVQDTKPLSMLTPPPGLPHLLNPAQPPLWTLPPSHESQGLSLGFLLPLHLLDTHRQPGVSWLEALAKLGFGSSLVEGSAEVPRLKFMATAAMEMGAAQTEDLPYRTSE